MPVQSNRFGSFDVSDELAAGIARHNKRIAPLLGTEVTITMPNGAVVTGVLSDDRLTSLTTSEGRRYAVWGAALEGLINGERDPSKLVCGFAEVV